MCSEPENAVLHIQPELGSLDDFYWTGELLVEARLITSLDRNIDWALARFSSAREFLKALGTLQIRDCKSQHEYRADVTVAEAICQLKRDNLACGHWITSPGRNIIKAALGFAYSLDILTERTVLACASSLDHHTVDAAFIDDAIVEAIKENEPVEPLLNALKHVGTKRQEYKDFLHELLTDTLET